MGIERLACILGKTLFSGKRGVKLLAVAGAGAAVVTGGIFAYKRMNAPVRRLVPEHFTTSDTTYYQGTQQPSSIEYRRGDTGRVVNFNRDGSLEGYADYAASCDGNHYEFEYHDFRGKIHTKFKQEYTNNGELIETDYVKGTVSRYNAETQELLEEKSLKKSWKEIFSK